MGGSVVEYVIGPVVGSLVGPVVEYVIDPAVCSVIGPVVGPLGGPEVDPIVGSVTSPADDPVVGALSNCSSNWFVLKQALVKAINVTLENLNFIFFSKRLIMKSKISESDFILVLDAN